jgi:hypothetical protein
VYGRAEQESASVRLRFHWLDATGRLIGQTSQSLTVNQGYSLLRLRAVAPVDTAAIVVDLAAAEGGPIWFDDASLQEEPLGVWVRYPRLGAERAGSRISPRTGERAVFAYPGGGFMQTVAVIGEQSYRLSFTAWSDDPQAAALLQIRWLDDDGQTLETRTRIAAVGQLPALAEAWMSAPPTATYATIILNPVRGGPIWYSAYALQAELREEAR